MKKVIVSLFVLATLMCGVNVMAGNPKSRASKPKVEAKTDSVKNDKDKTPKKTPTPTSAAKKAVKK